MNAPEDDRPDESLEQLLDLAARFPGDAGVAYRAACAHDRLGLEAGAVPFYERCLAGTGLPDEDRRGAFLGLGSTYRVLGQYTRAVETLRRGVAEYPDDGGLRTFLAMALYNTGEHHEAMSLLLDLLATTSQDPSVREYRRAIALYAGDLDSTG
ncbi:tetratricopeptide repeat protein [Streptomyces sp. MNU89]|uniref:tetratricopeptide repeat protein n=1 Tax=Streptomyces sp. MNU89 TaxID=2560025 RepID=UPI001E3255CE|nr:tetratricopeptide repeat protein [Streptomyces sp. MNU89]MCC9739881.1 tetratricopeptide repeat protein [Streptomyces sp. MNU89]